MHRMLAFAVLIFGASLQAQGTSLSDSTVAPKVYINGGYYDLDYIRTEITFVNYVLDRKNADIHVLITRQSTGSGGSEYTLFFMGQNAYVSENDTLVCITQQDDTEDTVRKKIVKVLKIGLLRYLVQTPIVDDISIGYAQRTEVMVKKDRWNNWVFQASINSFLNGEKSSRSAHLSGSLRADRITEAWKMRFSLNASQSENRYSYNEISLKSVSKSRDFDGLIVRSLTDHWSAGLRCGVSSSTYMNQKASLALSPAVEFNIFPYSESTRRELRLLYSLGYNYHYYHEETLYDRTEEGLLGESLVCTLQLTQPWGSAETSVEYSHYLHDLNKNRLSISSELDLRLFRGFSLNLFGGFSMIHDQLFLPKRGATMEEVLLSRRQLETNYSYWGSVGFSYTFGSIYNNIVNPRFSGSGGGRMIIIH